MNELRLEAQKLKGLSKMHEVAVERVVKLLTVLEKNIRDVLNEDGSLQVLITPNEVLISKNLNILRAKTKPMKCVVSF